MSLQIREGLKRLFEFYKELGFDRLPLYYCDGLSVMSNELEDEGVEIQMHHTSRTMNYCSKEAALDALYNEIGDCHRCKLSKGRTHIVFGEGDANARIMFIGEAPGREEDIQGRPFVGDAGQLLTRLIEKMGFKREDVYIANIVKCRPPMNRDPQEDEISTCFLFLDKQIQIISPEVIVSLGRISAYKLLNLGVPMSKFSITKIRGKFYEYKAGEKVIPVMPTFHPAYLLRNPKDKWLTWEDAQAVLKKLKD